MKKFYTIIFLAIWLNLFSQSDNFNFEHTIDRCINYQKSTIAIKDNRIFLSNAGSVETFNYDNNGNLSFDNDFVRYSFAVHSLTYGDSLIELNHDGFDKMFFNIYNIADGAFTLISTVNIELDNYNLPLKLKKNDNYLFYSMTYSDYFNVLDLRTLAFVDSIFLGDDFEIKGNHLFSKTNINGNHFDISSYDISDIHNPVFLSSLPINTNSPLREIKIIDNQLFLLTEDKVIIADVSDVLHPFIILSLVPPEVNSE